MIKKILALLIFDLLFFISSYYIERNILQTQNFYNVKAVKKCVLNLKPKTLKNYYDDFEVCGKNMRNLNEIGDMFVEIPSTKKVFWDASSDCKLSPSKSYLKKNMICSLFNSPESCYKASNILKQQENGNFIWYFYKTPEMSFFDTLKGKLSNGKKVTFRIVSGGEYNYILEIFLPLYILLFFFNVILFFTIKKEENESLS